MVIHGPVWWPWPVWWPLPVWWPWFHVMSMAMCDDHDSVWWPWLCDDWPCVMTLCDDHDPVRCQWLNVMTTTLCDNHDPDWWPGFFCNNHGPVWWLCPNVMTMALCNNHDPVWWPWPCVITMTLRNKRARKALDRSCDKLVKKSQWSSLSPQKHKLQTRNSLMSTIFVHGHQGFCV